MDLRFGLKTDDLRGCDWVRLDEKLVHNMRLQR